jgi:ribosomal protein S6E (S10)
MATGTATIAVKKKTQCQVTYWTKTAPMMRPNTEGRDRSIMARGHTVGTHCYQLGLHLRIMRWHDSVLPVQGKDAQ